MDFKVYASFGKLSQVGTLRGCAMTGTAGWCEHGETGPPPSRVPTLGTSPNHVGAVYKTQVLTGLF